MFGFVIVYGAANKEGHVLDEQRMGLMDILLINDGTPDNSAEMAREYVKKYPQYFRQIDKENGGHGSVWNMGVKEARGKYIRFLDSDDWLENVDVLLDKLKTTDADLALTHTLDHCPNNELWQDAVRGFEFNRIYNIDDYDWFHHKGSLNNFLHHSCTFKRNVLLPYIPLFLEKQPYDDSVLPMALICKAHTLVAFDIEVYHYLMDRPGQTISQEQRNKHFAAQMKVDQQTIQFLTTHIKYDNSPKSFFLEEKIRKLYQRWYTPSSDLSCEENKARTIMWDKWVHTQKEHPVTILITLYRCIPYRLYDRLFKFALRK